MANLDNLQEITHLDKGNVLGSIQALPRQVLQAWEEVGKIEIPDSYRSASKIVVSGMGGSALPGRVINSLFFSSNRAPCEVVTGYNLPNYVNEDTLIFLCSYSGGTAETISAFDDALMKKAKIVVLATGGKLAEEAKNLNLPAYIFDPKENPSKQPRMALGYSITALMAFLTKLEFINVATSEIQELASQMEEWVSDWGVRSPKDNNLAKLFAQKFVNKIPVLIASSHLMGIAHAFKNQLNENSKTFSLLFDIPELNHHLLEGLKNPERAKDLLLFTFLNSELYSSEVKKRFSITKDVVAKNAVSAEEVSLKAKSKLAQVYEILVMGSYISFYLSMLYGLDPTPIPWVDYFKEELAKG